MTYEEYKNKRQAEFNALPVFYAFSKEQFKKAMEERGLTENDTDQVRQWYGGGFYLKKDAHVIAEWLREESKGDKLKELMRDPKFAESAFLYEMNNHEYAINWQGDWDVCSCFGECKYDEAKDYDDYLTELGYDDQTITAYRLARKKHYKIAENW